ARGRRCDELIAGPQRQSGGIREASQSQLAQRAAGAVAEAAADSPRARNGIAQERSGPAVCARDLLALANRQRAQLIRVKLAAGSGGEAQHAIAVCRHELAAGIQRKLPGAGIEPLAARAFENEEP